MNGQSWIREARRRAKLEREFKSSLVYSSRVDQRVLIWFGHSGYVPIARRVLMAKASRW